MIRDFVIFSLERQKYAIALDSVHRVVRAAHVTPVPNAPGIFHGVINLAGEVTQVINLRWRLGLPGWPVGVSDRFIICRSAGKTIVLVVDDVHGIQPVDTSVLDHPGVTDHDAALAGILKTDDGLLLIYDLEKFLSMEDEQAMEELLGNEKSGS